MKIKKDDLKTWIAMRVPDLLPPWQKVSEVDEMPTDWDCPMAKKKGTVHKSVSSFFYLFGFNS